MQGFLWRYLEDGEGRRNLNNNYGWMESVSLAENITLAAIGASSYVLEQLRFHMVGEFPVIDNGISIQLVGANEEIFDLTGSLPLKSKADWLRVPGSQIIHRGHIGGEECFTVDIDFTSPKRIGVPINSNNQLQVVLRDDFSKLSGLYISACGFVVRHP